MNLRWAITLRGTYVHVALDLERAKGRTLCGKRLVDSSPWLREEFDENFHCARCWHKAEKLKETK